ncbi:DUF998 domain-containing protein [Spirochaeta isovalerica]|uniref:DUF998 domain-containing protein n=1 Tax=Spirochaeta isovalerica TaxID=150 RepID=A0A841RGB9_9SPIO|nr:DUF998 domain-containing protein [Spirochaeta isovalerica]MBB6481829.1 hypothetical protein [Spirochaeta isovalerica]
MNNNSLLYQSYIIIRRSIGYLGVFLPVLLILGGLFLNEGKVEFSLSAYYHNNLGDIFVMCLGASGILLVAYRGREPFIRILTSLGGVLALLVILFPTEVKGVDGPYGILKLEPSLSGTIHLVCASLFFIVLGVISFWRFTDHTSDAEEERRKLDRWYKLLGLTSMLCAAVYLVLVLFFKGTLEWYPILVVETVGLEAMGFTWLIKGAKTIGA